ncbi:MAG: hypothetical protein E6H73_08205 [Betaproteobacteria bacterium]|nr:MAG: hypothetical protein E6H73_08205 [Betaproteobacteria bacterium]
MASDIFLKVDGIKGEATDVDHKDEIEVVSWSYARSDKRGIDGPATVRADESRDFQSRRHDISHDRDGASLLDAADVRGALRGDLRTKMVPTANRHGLHVAAVR